MKADFDNAAQNYDTSFTHSVIGKLQRNLVHQHFSKILKESQPETILEINCGTGEDAIWLAKQNFDVTATDISEAMIAVAKNKIKLDNLAFKVANINTISNIFSNQKFDLIFSNFGGLNCLSKTELESFFKNASEIITKNGQLILVIMPENTLWEQLYFLSKLNFKSAFRRKKETAIANVDGENVTTYYYNPKDIVNLAEANFEIKQYKPIGFFVPPSYLEPFFKNKPKLISFLNALEQSVKNQSWLSKYADHYLIVLQKK
jgi:ubiquinone/menaquinone biosynthesis C-methylase UbiE